MFSRFARTRQVGALIPWVFENMSFLIPVHRLRETQNLIAFYHPQPSYPVHILILPKKAIASLIEVSSDDQPFLTDLFACVRDLVQDLKLSDRGYRLIANGGTNQDIPLLHFHLIADS